MGNIVDILSDPLFNIADKYVCPECVAHCCLNRCLSQLIARTPAEFACSFCNRCDNTPISIALSDLIEYMHLCISREYENPANCLRYDSTEGGYIGTTMEGPELILDELGLDFPKDDSGKLEKCIIAAFDEQDWCKSDWSRPNGSEIARISWKSFSKTVKHRKRYFFDTIKKSDDLSDAPTPRQLLKQILHYTEKKKGDDLSDALTPRQLLKQILHYAEKLGLVKRFQNGLVIHRARAWNNNTPWISPEDLGPPPSKKATQSNRMSPAGIPMFYGSEDIKTAVLEIETRPGNFSVGTFKTKCPVNLLDLTDIPTIPCIFEMITDHEELIRRDAIRFLRCISDEISKPIQKNGIEHIEYVPTQVVTEFIRSQPPNSERIHGIKYESSRHRGHCSIVLFATQDNLCIPDKTQWKQHTWLELKGTVHIKYRNGQWSEITTVPTFEK